MGADSAKERSSLLYEGDAEESVPTFCHSGYYGVSCIGAGRTSSEAFPAHYQQACQISEAGEYAGGTRQ